MKVRTLMGALLRVAASGLAGGVAYSLWLALFLVCRPLESEFVDLVLALISPFVTAAGFSAGVMAAERIGQARKPRFWSAFRWSLTGCIAGAVAVWPFGPMLIVFGMLCAGTAAVVAREWMLLRRAPAPRRSH